MDACTLLIVRRVRCLRSCTGTSALVLCLLAGMALTIPGCGAIAGLGTLGSSVDIGGDTGAVDLTDDTVGDCSVSYHHDTLSYGFELHGSAIEAVAWIRQDS